MNIEGGGAGENVKENKTKVKSESAKKLNEDKITKMDGEKFEDHSLKVAGKDIADVPPQQQKENAGIITEGQMPTKLSKRKRMNYLMEYWDIKNDGPKTNKGFEKYMRAQILKKSNSVRGRGYYWAV
jgi:hypothetical protein